MQSTRYVELAAKSRVSSSGRVLAMAAGGSTGGEEMRGRLAGAGTAGLATGFSLLCGWAFADGGEIASQGGGHTGYFALATVVVAAVFLLRVVSAEEKRLTAA